MIGTRYAWPSPMPCKIHVSMFRGECYEIAANCEQDQLRIVSQLYSSRVANSIPLMMKKFRADASLMRISRQFERDEMCYRNDLEVIPFSTDAPIEEDFLLSIGYQALHDGSLAV